MSDRYQDGQDEAIDEVIMKLIAQAGEYAAISEQCKEKKRESRSYLYKAKALLDFKDYLDSLYKTVIEVSSNEQP